MLRKLTLAYAHAPYVETGLELFRGWLANATGNLSISLHDSLVLVASALGITTTIIPSSRIYPNNGLSGQNRILDICKREGATTYINLPGGRALYDANVFRDAGIDLLFLRQPDAYTEALRSGIGDGSILSILDSIMHNPLTVLASAITRGVLQPAQQISSQPLELSR